MQTRQCMFTAARTALFLLAVAFAPAAAAEEKTGEQIYKQQCARCHGPAGEGTKKYAQPLVGDKTVAGLADVIHKTMPESDPGSLSAAEAKAVAAYIHEAFYSPDAQARLNPPRVELSRLTVRQYRNAVADVIAGFRTPGKWDEQRGLRGEYFNGRNIRNNARLIDRLDPEVNFDFGTLGPAEGFDRHQFSIRWEGSVLAPESGLYEFVVRTDHAARLWVNDPRKPLIDAWVKSGSDTEFRGTIPLLAGRAYPVRLEFSKAKQGVDDSKKNPNPPPKPASVALLWKVPHRAVEVIPARHLSPNPFPDTLVVEAPFPPDDRSYGWERATTISREWDAATTEAALEVAAYVEAHLDELAGVRAPNRDRGPNSGNPASINLDGKPDPKPSPERDRKLREFAQAFAERAFRRPLTEDQQRAFIDRQFEGSDPVTAVKRVVLLTLKSPRFLYREVSGGPDAYDVAARLAFTLWDSVPDRPLLDAAAAGALASPEEVARQAERMLADPRAKAKVREFLFTWLKVDHPPDMAKDPQKYPGFDEALAADLRTSLELFLDDVVWGENPDFRRLLLSDELFLNGRLAAYYGAEPPAPSVRLALLGPAGAAPSAAGFRKLKLDPGRRAGILTHPYLLAAFAYTGESSPIHRGVFVARGVLGLPLRPPPDAFTPLPADLHPTLTTRERIALQTRPAACVGCHGVINPLGFPMENFDAVGRYREAENGKPVAADGSYQTRAGELVTFAGVADLARFLADSEEVHAAFTTQLFHHLVKQPVRAYGLGKPAELRESFSRNGFDVRKLVVEVATTAALQPRDAKPPPNAKSN